MNVLRHAVIAGTGRAGTSFLVRYLSECGVDAGDLGQLGYFDDAKAGFERPLFGDDLPYLLKHPWLFEYLDKVDDTGIEIEALIVPVREIRDAAASRVLQERTWITEHFPDWPTRTTGGGVPGGSLYSLSVEDQAKVLALGQARLLSWAADKAVPVYLIGFPRLVDDAEYLYRALSPWITRFVDKDKARDVHQRMAEPSLVHRSHSTHDQAVSYDDLRVERDAMACSLTKVRESEVALKSRVAELQFEREVSDSRLSELYSKVHDLECEIASIKLLNDESQVILKDEKTRFELQLSDATALVENLRQQHRKEMASVARQKTRITELTDRVNVLETSTSYRVGLAVTAPARWVKRIMQGNAHPPSK